MKIKIIIQPEENKASQAVVSIENNAINSDLYIIISVYLHLMLTRILMLRGFGSLPTHWMTFTHNMPQPAKLRMDSYQ